MMKALPLFILTGCVFIWQPSFADIEVNFVESAPKDRFIIKNISDCALNNIVVEIDLTDSAGRLIFDTSSVGAGVEVFQPFESRSESLQLTPSSEVKDGDTELAVAINILPPGETVSFTIDVDDTVRDSALGQIRVADSEIEGGLVRISGDNLKPHTGMFGSDSRVTLLLSPCAST